MRHGRSNKKFNRTTKQRKALFKTLCENLFIHGSIKTTVEKAKAVRPIAEKLVTKAKLAKDSLSAYRALHAFGLSPKCCQVLRDRIAVACQERQGGYLSILKAGVRVGDNASMAFLSFVDEKALSPEKSLDYLKNFAKEKLEALKESA